MAYQTYITEALVCGNFDHQTSDRSFLLFTRDAGMLLAHAKSVREERSKHRYALQICSYIRVTLVRGKSGWRITGTEAISNVYNAMRSREGRAFLRNTIVLMRRVMHGESAHTEIFDDIMHALLSTEKYDSAELELILSIRILHALGYVAPDPLFTHLLHTPLEYAFAQTLTPEVRVATKKAIEHALMQSQL